LAYCYKFFHEFSNPSCTYITYIIIYEPELAESCPTKSKEKGSLPRFPGFMDGENSLEKRKKHRRSPGLPGLTGTIKTGKKGKGASSKTTPGRQERETSPFLQGVSAEHVEG
jgi:hypothetical protein